LQTQYKLAQLLSESDALSPRSAMKTLAEKSTVACNLRSVYSRCGRKARRGRGAILFRVSNEHSVYSVVNLAEQEGLFHLVLKTDSLPKSVRLCTKANTKFDKICKSLETYFFMSYNKLMLSLSIR